MKNKYKLCMINKNGYTIKKQFSSIREAKQFAEFYPLKSFFSWIYDTVNDEMIWQNCYKDKWEKCNNETFVAYY